MRVTASVFLWAGGFSSYIIQSLAVSTVSLCFSILLRYYVPN